MGSSSKTCAFIDDIAQIELYYKAYTVIQLKWVGGGVEQKARSLEHE
jgi:hypothetical protein